MFKKLAVVAGFVVLAGVAFNTGTLAVFTDTSPSSANTFTTGTLDLKLSDNNETDLDSVSTSVTFSNMAPGDTVTDRIVPKNSGSLALRYAIAGSATNGDAKLLKDQLVLTIKTIDVTTPGTPCDNFDGTQLYTGDTDSTAGKLVGDNAQGAQAGDRSLAAAASETLCFRVNLPLTTGNAFQNATTTVTFTFDAEQTVNNP